MAALPRPSGSNLLEGILQKLQEPDAGEWVCEGLAKSDRQLLEGIYEEAGLRGPVLYNPLGGVDTAVQHSFSPEITDVISHGMERYGDAAAIEAALLQSCVESSIGFDTGEDLERIESRYGCVGHLALGRLLASGAQITGMYAFSVTSNGKPVFGEGEQRVLTFEMGGVEKRSWYIQQVIGTCAHDRKSQLGAFVHRHRFDTLLLKGAHSLWFFPEYDEEFMSCVIEPARKWDARVIDDGNIDRRQTEGRKYSPRPIWRLDSPPSALDLGSLALQRGLGGEGTRSSWRLGYAEILAIGNGRDLVHKMPGSR